MIIDLLCYRRHGHNESDEPKFTQPSLYNLIAKHPNPRDVYFNKLKEEKDIDENYRLAWIAKNDLSLHKIKDVMKRF